MLRTDLQHVMSHPLVNSSNCLEKLVSPSSENIYFVLLACPLSYYLIIIAYK
jgi:hypothetical protein